MPSYSISKVRDWSPTIAEEALKDWSCCATYTLYYVFVSVVVPLDLKVFETDWAP